MDLNLNNITVKKKSIFEKYENELNIRKFLKILILSGENSDVVIKCKKSLNLLAFNTEVSWVENMDLD